MKRSKCVKAINLQFLSLTVDSWCQISHKKGFGAIYPAFERSYASVYHGFWLKISQMMGLVDICKRSNCVTAINLQFLPWQLTPDVRYLTEKVLVPYIQLLNAVMHDYIMDFDSKYPTWWVWLTYAKVWSVWKQLICNFFPWQLAPDVRYLTENVLLQYIQHLNAVMHHYIMDFDSKYPKWWVLLTYDVRSVWKPLICNFFPRQLTPDVRYLTQKVLGNISSIWTQLCIIISWILTQNM